MKSFITAFFWVSCFAACKTEINEDGKKEYIKAETVIPVAGTVLLADSMPIPDALNELYYSVKLIANEYMGQGTYDVKVTYGHNDAATQITFPRGGTKKLIPEIRKGADPFSYIIGFNYGEDDFTFYEYYLVKANSGQIEMKYLKAYSFQ